MSLRNGARTDVDSLFCHGLQGCTSTINYKLKTINLPITAFVHSMAFSQFITDLLTKGKLTLSNQLVTMEESDMSKCREILHSFYEDDKLDMPLQAPPFTESVAIWAAEYFYNAVQLTIVREAGEELVIEKLKLYKAPINASAIYSADLILRHLPRLLDLAKGLAPADRLVKELRNAAIQWPFSSVGVELDQPVDDAALFADPSLKLAYVDRIVQQKDKHRLSNEEVVRSIYESAGENISLLWPEFENYKQPLNGITELTAK